MIEFYEIVMYNHKDGYFSHDSFHDSFHMTLESAEARHKAIYKEQEKVFSLFRPEIEKREFMDGLKATEFEIPVLANFSNTAPRGVLGKGRIINSGKGSAIFITTNEPFDPEFLDGMVAMSFAWCAANPYVAKRFYKETNG